MSADEHGAAVIPHALARELQAVILKMRRNRGFTVEKLKRAIARSKRVH